MDSLSISEFDCCVPLIYPFVTNGPEPSIHVHLKAEDFGGNHGGLREKVMPGVRCGLDVWSLLCGVVVWLGLPIFGTEYGGDDVGELNGVLGLL